MLETGYVISCYVHVGYLIYTTLGIRSFLATNNARDVFQFEKIHQVGIPDYECLEKHMIENNPINTQIDGRIVIEYENGPWIIKIASEWNNPRVKVVSF